MTSHDSMAYNDPVGAQACADAGRFGEPNPQPRLPVFDPIDRCSYCDGSGRVMVDVDETYGYLDACPVCQPGTGPYLHARRTAIDPETGVEVPTFLPYPWSAP